MKYFRKTANFEPTYTVKHGKPSKAKSNLTDYSTSFTGLGNEEIADYLRGVNLRYGQKSGPTCQDTFGADFENRIFLVDLATIDLQSRARNFHPRNFPGFG